MCKRLQRRIGELGLPDLHTYRSHLERESGEWRVLEACCRVTLSRFYRDRVVFESLGRQVLPELAARARADARSALRGWCAGCASGEEVYTLRALWDLGVAPEYPGLELELIGTDIDADCLARARRGRYRASSLREVPSEWRERVFESGIRPDDDESLFSVRTRFRHGIEFRSQDLRREMPDGPFDLLLCRNLAFTYWDRQIQREVLGRIVERLMPGGALVVGVHEQQGLERFAHAPDEFGITPWQGLRAVFRSTGASKRRAALQVECRVGEAGREPKCFGRHGSMCEVAEILDRWPGEGHRYFRLRTLGGDTYILRHDEDRDRWAIHYFERGD